MGCTLVAQGDVDGVIAYRNNGVRFQSNSVTVGDKEHFTGIKYQCVEYARRYLILTRQCYFEDVGTARDIYPLQWLVIVEGGRIPFKSFQQGGFEPPQKGDLIIYEKSSRQWWGHVAVVSFVKDGLVGLAEQNFADNWEGPNYSRMVRLKEEGGRYWLTNQRPNQAFSWDLNEVVIGWKRPG